MDCMQTGAGLSIQNEDKETKLNITLPHWKICSVHLFIFNYTDSGNYTIQQRQISLQMESTIQVKYTAEGKKPI